MRIMSFVILIFLGIFTTTAFAAGVVSSDQQGLVDMLRSVLDAAVHGQPMLAAALAVVLLCALARKYMPSKYKDGVKGDIVGTALAFMMAFAGAVATALATPGAHLTLALIGPAASVGLIAIGGYTAIHKLMTWITATTWYQTKAPDWVKAIMKLSSLFGSDAVKKAEVAGAAAVKADPSPGMAGPDVIKEVE